MTQAVKLDLSGTPEKFQPLAEEIVLPLADLLGELAALEDKHFAQYIRLCNKGRIIEFKDGVRTEFTDPLAWKDECKVRFAHFLAPHCTQKLAAQRRECLHITHFPSSFNCLHTGCELVVTMKSAKKAEVCLIPGKGAPFDLTNPDVRYLVEDMKSSGHSAQTYSYFQKFRFILKLEEDGWKIDEVYSAATSEDRWRRDWYF